MAAVPHVEHQFNGDSKLLRASEQQRGDIRQALIALQQELQRLEGCSTQITAEIKFNLSGPDPREHIYTVAVSDTAFDTAAFARTKTSATCNRGAAVSPPASSKNERRASSCLVRNAPDDDHFVEVRPFKKARPEGPDGFSPSRPSHDAGSVAEDDSVVARLGQLNAFIRSWHDEWTRQGGWLFDNLTGANKTSKEHKAALDKQLMAVQDVLGQSINAANATAMAELANITKLLPWLEHCRKTNADKVQAREEKWRSSSATFHDQTRRERETAERRLEERLEAQQRLLVKIAEANGVDVDEFDDKGPSREESLGAQLTAELNLEAARAGGNGNGTLTKHHNAINIDD